MLDDLTKEEAQDLFIYDPREGLLRWRYPAGRGGRYWAGSVAGRIHLEGYRYITVLGRQYRASRVIWLWMTGSWPKHQIDHKDRNPSNDKWENLREATGSENKSNSGKYKGNPKSCHLKGVQAVQKRHSTRYRAVVTKDGQRHNLGNFATAEEAHAAYLEAASRLHGEFFNGA